MSSECHANVQKKRKEYGGVKKDLLGNNATPQVNL